MIDLYSIEDEIYDSGVSIICGVDEAGRGPLAGPVYAAAVILNRDTVIEGLNDSKKLSEKKRELLYDQILNKAYDWSCAFATVEEIDSCNILNATYLAMNRAMEGLRCKFDLALIDGNRNTGISFPSRCIIGGDGKCSSIAAASIIAKVTRDRYMLELDRRYPQYGFKKHKGYGTKLHYDCIQQYGVSPVHRKSFLKNLQGGNI